MVESWWQAGVVHGDMKPSNIVLDDELTPYVLDVETVAWLDSSRSSQRCPAGFRHTEGYAAPELTERNRVCASTDMYSLGVTIQRIAEAVRPLTYSLVLLSKSEGGGLCCAVLVTACFWCMLGRIPPAP